MGKAASRGGLAAVLFAFLFHRVVYIGALDTYAFPDFLFILSGFVSFLNYKTRSADASMELNGYPRFSRQLPLLWAVLLATAFLSVIAKASGFSFALYKLLVFPSVIWLVLNAGPLNRVLMTPSLQFLGALSFSLYLWHYPILKAMALGVHLLHKPHLVNRPWFYWLWATVTIICSVISHYCLELPIKKWFNSRGPVRYGTRILIFSAATGAVAVFAVFIVLAARFSTPSEPISSVVFSEREGYDVTYSYETIGYDIEHYWNRFITSPEWQTANGIVCLADTTENDMRVIHLLFDETYYTYVTIPEGGNQYRRYMFRSNSEQFDFRKHLQIPKQPEKPPAGFTPVIPEFWSEETRALYARLCTTTTVDWGIFEPDFYTELPALEKQLGYKFPVMLQYLHINQNFPLDFYRDIYSDERYIELTLQLTTSNNLDLYGRSPMLSLIRGDPEIMEQVRVFARNLSQLEHPVLFRLNNEMNSDWTSYSGVINLCDPALYVSAWRIIYDIFKEEGVDNAIWVWNANDNNYPPARWNDALQYWPGEEYVQMLGVTGYNTGTYYADVTGEYWREFKDIYDEINAKCLPLFENYPWIITEFGSSTVGGDRVKWLDGMFESLADYPNIKAAVWFNQNDYDYRAGRENEVSRPYRLDGDESSVAAFARGLHTN